MTRARFPDPYEGMSDEELDQHLSELITENRQRQRAISIRFPEELLDELQRLAARVGVRYQTLIKLLLEQDIARLRAHPLPAGQGVTRSTAKQSGKSTQRSPAAKGPRPAPSKRAAKKRTTRRPRVPA